MVNSNVFFVLFLVAAILTGAGAAFKYYRRQQRLAALRLVHQREASRSFVLPNNIESVLDRLHHSHAGTLIDPLPGYVLRNERPLYDDQFDEAEDVVPNSGEATTASAVADVDDEPADVPTTPRRYRREDREDRLLELDAEERQHRSWMAHFPSALPPVVDDTVLRRAAFGHWRDLPQQPLSRYNAGRRSSSFHMGRSSEEVGGSGGAGSWPLGDQRGSDSLLPWNTDDRSENSDYHYHFRGYYWATTPTPTPSDEEEEWYTEDLHESTGDAPPRLPLSHEPIAPSPCPFDAPPRRSDSAVPSRSQLRRRHHRARPRAAELYGTASYISLHQTGDTGEEPRLPRHGSHSPYT